jgi:hypothetical protein
MTEEDEYIEPPVMKYMNREEYLEKKNKEPIYTENEEHIIPDEIIPIISIADVNGQNYQLHQYIMNDIHVDDYTIVDDADPNEDDDEDDAVGVMVIIEAENSVFTKCLFHITNEDINNICICNFRNSFFEDCEFYGEFRNLDFTNAIFNNCKFNNMIFDTCIFNNAIMENSELISIHGRSIIFTDAKLFNVDLNSSKIHNSDLTNAILDNVNLTNVELDDSKLKNATMTSVNFTKTSLWNMDPIRGYNVFMNLDNTKIDNTTCYFVENKKKILFKEINRIESRKLINENIMNKSFELYFDDLLNYREKQNIQAFRMLQLFSKKFEPANLPKLHDDYSLDFFVDSQTSRRERIKQQIDYDKKKKEKIKRRRIKKNTDSEIVSKSYKSNRDILNNKKTGGKTKKIGGKKRKTKKNKKSRKLIKFRVF